MTHRNWTPREWATMVLEGVLLVATIAFACWMMYGINDLLDTGATP